jgi:hypothetical protein
MKATWAAACVLGVVGCGDTEEPVWREPDAATGDFTVYVDDSETPAEVIAQIIAAAGDPLREFCQQSPSASVWISSPRASAGVPCRSVLANSEPERATAAAPISRHFRAHSRPDIEEFATEEPVPGGGGVGFSPAGFACAAALLAVDAITYETNYCERVWKAHRKGPIPEDRKKSCEDALSRGKVAGIICAAL